MIPEAADLSPWHAVPDPIAWTLHCHFASNPSKGPNTTQKHSSLPSQFAAAALHYCTCPTLSQHPCIPHALPSWKYVTAHRVPAFAHPTCRANEVGRDAEGRWTARRFGVGVLISLGCIWCAFLVWRFSSFPNTKQGSCIQNLTNSWCNLESKTSAGTVAKVPSQYSK